MADDQGGAGDRETPGERYRRRRWDDPGGGAYAEDRDDSAARRRAERRRRGQELQRDVPKPRRSRPPGYRWYDGWGDGAEYGCCLLELLWSTAAVVVAVGVATLAVRRSRRGSAGGRTGGTAAPPRGSS